MTVELATIQADWDQAARENATFNILTDSQYANSGWPTETFFDHGRAEIDAALEHLAVLGVEYKTNRALDFGCGVGRLTEALAYHFRRVDGVDVSEEMIRLAKERPPRTGHTHYHHNARPDLKLFRSGTFDLVYTMIVLQHMPQEMQHGYVREFFRVLKPEGVAMIDIPDGPEVQHPRRWLSMTGVPRATVEQWIELAGAQIVDAEPLPEPSQWQHYRYTAVAR